MEKMPERYGYFHDECLANLRVRMTMEKSYLMLYLVNRTALAVTIIRTLYGRRD